MADVFISYSRADAEYVRRLQGELQSRGKDVWMDVEGIRDAELFPAALLRAIESSDAFVFVITPESVRSAFCEQEVAHASDLFCWRSQPCERRRRPTRCSRFEPPSTPRPSAFDCPTPASSSALEDLGPMVLASPPRAWRSAPTGKRLRRVCATARW